MYSNLTNTCVGPGLLVTTIATTKAPTSTGGDPLFYWFILAPSGSFSFILAHACREPEKSWSQNVHFQYFFYRSLRVLKAPVGHSGGFWGPFRGLWLWDLWGRGVLRLKKQRKSIVSCGNPDAEASKNLVHKNIWLIFLMRIIANTNKIMSAWFQMCLI